MRLNFKKTIFYQEWVGTDIFYRLIIVSNSNKCFEFITNYRRGNLLSEIHKNKISRKTKAGKIKVYTRVFF